MKGTEKQVKWAESIKAETLRTVERICESLDADLRRAKIAPDDARAVEVRNTVARCITKLDAWDAEAWINSRSQIIDRKWVQKIANS